MRELRPNVPVHAVGSLASLIEGGLGAGDEIRTRDINLGKKTHRLVFEMPFQDRLFALFRFMQYDCSRLAVERYSRVKGDLNATTGSLHVNKHAMQPG